MAEYALTKTFDVSPDRLWAVATDLQQASRWLPTTRASSVGGGHVQLSGESHGHHYDTAAPLKVDASARRLSWSTGDGSSYRGWLQVAGDGGRADVTVHLDIADERPSAGQPDEVERGMAEALDRLAELARG